MEIYVILVKICTKHNFEMQFTDLNILFENFAIHQGHWGKMRVVNLPKWSKNESYLILKNVKFKIQKSNPNSTWVSLQLLFGHTL